MKKHQSKGFTLVEVIVVAVIVAILAGIAIPLYTSYVKDARQGTVDNAASAIASFMGVSKNAGAAVSGIPASGVAGGTLTATPAGGTATTMQIPTTVKAVITTTDVTCTSVKDSTIVSPTVKY